MLSLALFQRIWRRKILIWTCNAAPFADPSRCFCYRLCSCYANLWRTSTEPISIKWPLPVPWGSTVAYSGFVYCFWTPVYTAWWRVAHCSNLSYMCDEPLSTEINRRSAASHPETSPNSLLKSPRLMLINEISLSWMLCLFNMNKSLQQGAMKSVC